MQVRYNYLLLFALVTILKKSVTKSLIRALQIFSSFCTNMSGNDFAPVILIAKIGADEILKDDFTITNQETTLSFRQLILIRAN